MTPAISYERITYRPEGQRARTIYVQDACVSGTLFSGIEVDREGDEVASRGFDERRHIIALALIVKRTPMVMDKIYGELVEADQGGAV